MGPWDTLLLWNSKEKKCCLYETPYGTALIQVLGDVIANSMPYVQLPTDAPFSGSWVMCLVRDPSHHFETPMWNFHEEIYKWYQNGLLMALPEESHEEYFQVSLQADSALTCRHEQKPQELWRTRWPWEKGRWAISPDSLASHSLHSYSWVLQPIKGMTSTVTDFEKHAKRQGYIEEPAAKNFIVRKIHTIK